MSIYLVRHGQSEWNKQGRIQGQKDSPLTELGRQQAIDIGERLAMVLDGKRVRVFTSPLGRARETAELVVRKLGFPVNNLIVEQRLNDFNLGSIAGYYGWDKVAEAHPELARLRLEDPFSFAPENGESGGQVDARLRLFLNDLVEDSHETLIISHGVINKFIRAIRLGITGGDIIAQGESQRTVYKLDGNVETAIDL